MAVHVATLALGCLLITATRQAVLQEDSFETQNERAAVSEADHNACVDAWAEVNRRQDNGCVDPLDVHTYEERCQIPELRQRIRDLLSRCEQNKPKQFMSVSHGRDSDMGEHPRSKRMVFATEHQTWPQAKVPWINASDNNKRAMRTIERYTCIRFVPWETIGNQTTNQRLGLGHTAYVDFVYEGGCWATQGNKRHGRQKVSCCGGIVCLHEICHALGAYHEQSNPLGMGQMRLNPYNTERSHASNFRPVDIKMLEEGKVYSSGYDQTSLLGYPLGQFGNGKGSPIDYMFSDLHGGNDWFYMMQEISHVHKCDQTFCSHFTMPCVNDGYLTLVDNVCACMCPKGLDPSTGCKTPLKDYPETWPLGTYGIPKAKDGCPDGFDSGAVIHTGEAPAPCQDSNPNACRYWFRSYGCFKNPGFMNDKCPKTCNVCETFGNHVSPNFALSGYTNNDQVEDDFCVKVDTSNDDPTIKWMGGQYCIYRKGGVCPDGLLGGSVIFTDDHHSNASNSKFGVMVDGEFTQTTTQLEYCCSVFGFESDELVLPRSKPFALLKSGASSFCHNVRGMHFYEGYSVVRNKGGKPNITGHTPVVKYNEARDEWKIPYCYYVPTNKSCGGSIDLTSANPTATFEVAAGQEFSCNWIIKAPATSRILLNFDTFNVTADASGKCIDKVEVKWDRPGQTGSVFCGADFQKSISSVNNTILVNFETYNLGPEYPGTINSEIKATVTLINDDNLCYTEATRGHGYVGPMNRTRGMKPCLPWAEVGHCLHHPFSVKEMVHSLTDNHCRNPDLSDGLRPWCYTNYEQCYRDYCDVCQFENLYDTYKDCEILAKLGYCENDPNTLQNCAKTCQNNIPSFPKPQPAKTVTCSTPGPVSDGDIVGPTKASYSIGEVVTYKCKNQAQPTISDRTCQTTGQWSSLNYVCSECEPDWLLHDSNCYRLFHPVKTQPGAIADCQAKGAKLVMAKSQAEVEWLASLSYWDGTWLDADDKQIEGTWKWGDGTLFANTWTNWAHNQPENYGNEDCVWMQPFGQFEDRWCTRDTYHYVCVKPQYAVSGCDDVTDDCANFYANNATACTTQGDFMSSNCRKTCGLCGSPVTCTVEAATGNAIKSSDKDVQGFDQGQWVKYECKPGFQPVSGDDIRGCLADGRMSGKPLVCEAEFALTSTTVLDNTGSWGGQHRKNHVNTGAIPGMVIPHDGRVVRWEWWSTQVGDGAFQVWRNTSGAQDKLEFIGQNLVTSPDDWMTTYYVPAAEQITVKKGDYIGLWLGDQMAGVGYTRCDQNDHPGMTDIKLSKQTYTDPSAFHPSSTYEFVPDTKDVCRLYKWRAVVEP